MKRLINGVLFQIVWFLTIGLASQMGELYAALPGLTFTIYLGRKSATQDLKRIVIWISLALFLGLICESSLIAQGILLPIDPPLIGIPLWLLTLWTSLFMLLWLEITWLLTSPLLLTLCGLFSAPLSYASGARLGAMSVGGSYTEMMMYTGALWAVAMLIASYVYRGLNLHK